MPGCYAWGVNTLNRGGIVQTRPRRRRIASFIGTYAQGTIAYRTFDQTQYQVVAIDGLIYYSQFPFNMFTVVPGITFNKFAPRIYFCVARQSVQIVGGNIVLLPNPIDWLLMQDGVSSAAWWVPPNSTPSGFNSSNQPYSVGQPTMLPIGKAMAFSGNRLWVAVDHQVFASDILNPQRFLENTYVALQSAFYFPKPVVQLFQGPLNQGLFVTTEDGLYNLQSNILNRTQWQTTPQFQTTITEEFGSPAPFSIVNQHGLPWFWSSKGFMSMDMALNTQITNVIYPRDGEMVRSKNRLSPSQQGICAGIFENVLLLAVPSMSQFNRHTWVMDGGVANKLQSSSGICWSSVWTGTFPVQFSTFKVNGVEHCLELSYSGGSLASGGNAQGIHLWENFLPGIQKDDNTTPVQSSMETRMYMCPNDELNQACFVELQLANVYGNVTLNFYMAGIAGLYQLVSVAQLRADIGPFGNTSAPGGGTLFYGFTGQANTQLESFRPQTRYVRSAETVVTAGSLANSQNPHMIELGTLDWIDKGFQILLTWTGNMGARAIKFFYLPRSEPSIGQLGPSEFSTPKIVLETGY